MAISKTYNLILSDDSTPGVITLNELQDAAHQPAGVSLEVEPRHPILDDKIYLALSLEEAHELRAVLSLLLGCATHEEIVLAEGSHIIAN